MGPEFQVFNSMLRRKLLRKPFTDQNVAPRNKFSLVELSPHFIEELSRDAVWLNETIHRRLPHDPRGRLRRAITFLLVDTEVSLFDEGLALTGKILQIRFRNHSLNRAETPTRLMGQP